jgi:hypothetical protein
MAVAGLAVTPKEASRLMLERLAGIAGLTNIPAATYICRAGIIIINKDIMCFQQPMIVQA